MASILRAARRRLFPSESVDPYARVSVVFRRSDRDVDRLDIVAGPCRGTNTRKKPLVGVTNQEPGDHRTYEALYRILNPGTTRSPWKASRSAGTSRLDTFADGFVATLTAMNRDALRRDAERPKDYEWMFAQTNEVAERWHPEVDWRRPVSVRWLSQHLMWVTAVAREAFDLGQGLYCWSGPGFDPWTPPLLTKYGRLSRDIQQR